MLLYFLSLDPGFYLIRISDRDGRLMKEASMVCPVCAMEDESAIFIKGGKADLIGVIHRIEKGEIGPFTEKDVRA